MTPENRGKLEKALLEVAADPKARLYAAFDGASAPGLAGKLEQAGVAHRSLYLGAEASLMAGGPWLVDPYHFQLTDDDFYEPYGEDSVVRKRNVAPRPADPVEQVQALLAALTDSRAAVFWIGDASLTEEDLYQHLRGLNRITIDTEPGSPFKTETVTFRHADANVMAQVLPALDPPRYARFLGPALAIVFTPHEEWGGDCIRAANLEKSVVVPKGFLHWDRATLDAIGKSRLEVSRRKVMDYLREVDPTTEEFSNAELYRRVISYETSGNSLGLKSERAHMKWAYLMSITDGNADQDGVAAAYFRESPKHPDDAIDDILDALDDAAGDDWDRFWLGGGR